MYAEIRASAGRESGLARPPVDFRAALRLRCGATLPAMHSIRYHRLSFRCWRTRLRERSTIFVLRRMPTAWKDRVWLHRTGELTCTPALRHQEVPAATVQQLMAAMDA